MENNEAKWLNMVQVVARDFIESNYTDEASFFDAFWEAFVFRFETCLAGVPFEQLTPDTTGQVLSDISLTRQDSIDLMTPIIIGAAIETAYALKSRKLTIDELEAVVESAAGRLGADKVLSACLIKNLPALFVDLLHRSNDAKEALIREAPDPLYKIWTNGRVITTDSINEYENNKDAYIIWLDLDKKPEKRKSAPDQGAIRLLRYLVEHIGSRTPVADIPRHVYGGYTGLTNEHDKNKIGQHLTQLHNFSRKQFREYLLPNWTTLGLGLRNSFKKRYILFTRIRRD